MADVRPFAAGADAHLRPARPRPPRGGGHGAQYRRSGDDPRCGGRRRARSLSGRQPAGLHPRRGAAADREAFLCEHLWELDEIPSSEGIRTERWKYMRYRFIPGREELYDLAADSEEAVNLASDPAYGRTLEELRRECNRQIERYVSLRRHCCRAKVVPPRKIHAGEQCAPRPYAFSGKSVRNASRGFFCRNEGFPRIFPMECNLLWLKMFGSLFRAGTCCRRAVCISSEKSVSLSEEPASEGGRLIALGGLLPAGRILPAKR